MNIQLACATLLLLTSCGSPSRPDADPVTAPPSVAIGGFPNYPAGDLPAEVTLALQDVLDEAVGSGMIRGATVGVVVAGAGSWAGAAGSDPRGKPLAPDSRTLTASVGKTITAAQVMRLTEEGKLDLDDPAADHLPAGFSSQDVNGASVRDLLGMRSGLADPLGYVGLVDRGLRTEELLARTAPMSRPAATSAYASINYLLLGEIIEAVTGRPLAEAIRAGVLDDQALDGIDYGVEDAMAADGWRIVADPRTLSRWGYELYGGFVVSERSLRAMTDFGSGTYGLGTIDLSGPDEYDSPGAIGHGGMEVSHVVRLVAFPEGGIVISVQANAFALEEIHGLVSALANAARS